MSTQHPINSEPEHPVAARCQLTLQPSLFGGNDGPGWSIVYCFALPADFDPVTYPNQKALGLYKRFVHNGREADGSSTRERCVRTCGLCALFVYYCDGCKMGAIWAASRVV